MFTIATTPRPLDNEVNRREFKNATRSWERIQPQLQIIVFGNVPAGLVTPSMELVPAFPQEPDGRPLFDSFIGIAEERATHEVVVYATDHLIFLWGLRETVELISGRFDQFLLMGRRWDVDFSRSLDFSGNRWQHEIRNQMRPSKLGSIGAKDWLVWRRPFPKPIPPFIMGIPWYDTWMVVRAEELGFPRIDASATVGAIHPIHEFPFPGGIHGRRNDPRYEYNRGLAPGCAHRGHITDSEWITTGDPTCPVVRKGKNAKE